MVFCSREDLKKGIERNKALLADFMAKSTTDLKRKMECMPSSTRNLFFKAYSGKATRAELIKAKCLDCSSYQRDEITHCTVRLCPLWNGRPYQK